ncbi:MAG: hypothetical protein P8L79_11405 [Rhodospirillaceae bacterium]|nr:hypothetical protein [Rhodospirillaceae bacterium]
MAIGKLTLDLFEQVMPHISSRPIALVTVGYPDCLVPASLVGEMFGKDIIDKLAYRDDSDKIIAWHSLGGKLDKVIETRSLLELLGIEITVLDISEVRGGEIICDLNHPIPPELNGRFDIVLDGGTMEHCFNIGQVINNLVSMAKVNGFVIHGNPLVVMNHGFFNFSPTFYYDYYIDNGHRLPSPIYGYVHKEMDYQLFELPPTKRFGNVPDNSWVSVVAQKLHDRGNKWPMQTKYKNSPTLGG